LEFDARDAIRVARFGRVSCQLTDALRAVVVIETHHVPSHVGALRVDAAGSIRLAISGVIEGERLASFDDVLEFAASRLSIVALNLSAAQGNSQLLRASVWVVTHDHRGAAPVILQLAHQTASLLGVKFAQLADLLSVLGVED
jgi:hypothetical protein